MLALHHLASKHSPATTHHPPLSPCSLEKPETLGSGQVLGAMLHLLSLTLARVPNAVLRAKFGAGSALLCGILEAKQEDAAVAKNAVPCVGALLAAHNPADWPAAVRPFNLLLRWADGGVRVWEQSSASSSRLSPGAGHNGAASL